MAGCLGHVNTTKEIFQQIYQATTDKETPNIANAPAKDRNIRNLLHYLIRTELRRKTELEPEILNDMPPGGV